MQFFSNLYKKMCERAAEVQASWPDDEDIYACRKSDYSEDVVRYYCQLSDEEKRKAKTNYFWIPIDVELSHYVFPRFKRGVATDYVFEKMAAEYISNKEIHERF